MDFIIELFLELILEGSLEISKNKKIPKIIRYPLIFLIVLFFGIILVFMFLVSVSLWKRQKIISFLMFIISLSLFFACIYKFKKIFVIKIRKINTKK